MSRDDVVNPTTKGRFVSFQRVLSLALEERPGPRWTPSEKLRAYSQPFFEHVEKLCRVHEMNTISVELAILQETRGSVSRQAPVFLSLVEVKLPEQYSARYLSAMDCMEIAPEGYGNLTPEPIVTHTGLYSSMETVCFEYLVQSNSVSTGIKPAGVQAGISKHNAILFESDVTSNDTAIGDQIAKFSQLLVDASDENRALLKGEPWQFDDLQVLVLPLTRTSIETVRMSAKRITKPVGALIVVCKSKKRDESNRRKLIRDVSSYISECVGRDVNDALDQTHRQQKILAAALHTSVNAIASIQASTLHAPLARNRITMPQKPDELEVDFVDKKTGKSDPVRASDLLRRFGATEMKVRTAAAICSLGEMSIERGIVRPKFQNGKPTKLRKIIQDAGEMSQNAIGSRSDFLKPIALVFGKGFSDRDGEEVVVPENYISQNILSGVFLEVLQNASKHGRDESGSVSVKIDCEFFSDNSLLLEFSNPISEWSGERQNTDQLGGYLRNFQEIFQQFGQLNIAGDIQNDEFILSLKLGPLEYTNESSTQRLNDLTDTQWCHLVREGTTLDGEKHRRRNYRRKQT